MAKNDVAGELRRLDAALTARKQREAQVLHDRTKRQERLNEVQRGLLRVFQARARDVNVKMFRLIVETTQAAVTDLSKPVQALFSDGERATFWKQIGFVQMSLASSAAPALRGYLGHMVGVVFEATDRCVVLVFPTTEVALGSLEPLDGQVTRIEVGGVADLHEQEPAVDAALVAGIRMMIDRIEEEQQ